MAICIPFDGANRHYVSGEELPCGGPPREPDMFGYTNGFVTYSCWQLSPEEIMQIRETGQVWIAIKNGREPMRQTFVGSLSSIKRACADLGRLWKPRRAPKEESNDAAHQG